MMQENTFFLGDDLLIESDTSFSLDIISSQKVLQGEVLGQKKILEGKLTLNTASNLMFSLPPSVAATSMDSPMPDRTKWDLYLCVIPFAIEMPSGSGNSYKRMTFHVNLTTPGALAFDLFPKNIVALGAEQKTYGLAPDYRIRELKEYQEHIGKIMSFAHLRPKITSTGKGNSSFHWLYEGSSWEQNTISPGVKQVLIVLQVPRGTQVVDGSINCEVVIAKRLLGTWQDIQASTDVYPLHWQLNEATQFSLSSPAPEEVPADAYPNALFDVCIICAMAEELQAFVKVTEKECNVHFQDSFSRRTNRQYMYTTIRNKNGEALRLHASWQSSYGPLEASLHLRPVLEEFQPRFAAMTGICAGDRRKVKLGDIIVAERAFLYDTGKFVSDVKGQSEHLRDTDTWRSYPDVLQMVRLFTSWKNKLQDWSRPPSKLQQRDWLLNKLLDPQTPRVDVIPQKDLYRYVPSWRKIISELQAGEKPYLTKERALRDPSMVNDLFYGEEEFPYQDPAQPAVYIAPIASGNAVRADLPFEDIQVPVRGTLAIDMEGAAFYRTVGDFSQIRSLVVKGVSDYADSEKDDTYRTYAVQASAAYMLAFIQEFVTSERMPRLQKAEAQSRAEVSSLATTVARSSIEARNTSKPEDAKQTEAINIFFSYAPEDEVFARQLEKHLVLLKRQGLITSWHSRKIVGGQEPEQEIGQQLQQAQIILLLISPDFLFSDINYNEMTRAVKARESRKVAVVPVLLRSTDELERTPIGKLLILPRNHKPVQQWHDRDAAFAEIAREIRSVVEIMKKSS